MAKTLLYCENIHKAYGLGRTSLPVLCGVSQNIQAGQFVAIIGSSGSGKSTLLHVLSGMDVPQRGQVYYEGQPLFEPEGIRKVPLGRDARGSDSQNPSAPQSLRGNYRHMAGRRNELLNAAFGFVFQFYHLLPEFNVLENVELPQMVGNSIGGWLAQRANGSTRALELLHRVGLGDRLKHRPNELSGGERQRVAIARALINQPTVLFADEPTGNLDAKTGRDIFTLLQDLNRAGQTLVLVTHDSELANKADVVVRLVDGRVQ